jgi:hypothetical protein
VARSESEGRFFTCLHNGQHQGSVMRHRVHRQRPNYRVPEDPAECKRAFLLGAHGWCHSPSPQSRSRRSPNRHVLHCSATRLRLGQHAKTISNLVDKLRGPPSYRRCGRFRTFLFRRFELHRAVRNASRLSAFVPYTGRFRREDHASGKSNFRSSPSPSRKSLRPAAGNIGDTGDTSGRRRAGTRFP